MESYPSFILFNLVNSFKSTKVLSVMFNYNSKWRFNITMQMFKNLKSTRNIQFRIYLVDVYDDLTW